MTQINQTNHTLQDQLAALKGKVRVVQPKTVEVRRAKTWRKRGELESDGHIEWETEYVKPHWECLNKTQRAQYMALFIH
jgi:hypothetical protein